MGKIILWLKLSLCISFTSITVIVSVIGSTINSGGISNFDVRITKAKLDHVEISNQAILNYGTSLSFTTNELKNVGDASVLDYEISNYSKKMDVFVSINCTQNNNEYYTIYNEFPEIIKANSKEKGSLVVVLEKASFSEFTDNFSCSLNITEKNSKDYTMNLSL